MELSVQLYAIIPLALINSLILLLQYTGLYMKIILDIYMKKSVYSWTWVNYFFLNPQTEISSLSFFFLDNVGCFEIPHVRSRLQRVPESPQVVQTKFYLYRRDIKFSNPEVLYYDDAGKSLESSRFNSSQPLKLIIHGFMSKWNQIGSLIAADAYLKMVSYSYNKYIMIYMRFMYML